MVEPDAGSTVPRRQLGRMLKEARESAGLALDGAARELEFSRNKMYRIEGGRAPLRKVDVVAMCSLYGVARDLVPVLVALAAETRNKGWWHAYGEVIPPWFELFVGLEAAASRIREYQAGLIPGLLQVEEYAEVMFRRTPDVQEEQVAQRVNVRLERQKVLSRRRPPLFDAILDESVLHRPIPDRDGWRKQLAALLTAGARPGIRIRVIPSSAGPYRGVDQGSFRISNFPEEGRYPEPTTVYSEGLTGAIYLDKPVEIAVFDMTWNALATLALSPEASAILIQKLHEEIPA